MNYSYLTLKPIQVTEELRTLFNLADPASLRCQAVLNGHAAGRIFTDHPDSLTWGVIQEAGFGSIYLAGELEPSLLHNLIEVLRKDGDVLVGLWKEDPRWSFMPPKAEYTGYTLDFTDRDEELELPEIPAGCVLRRLDPSLSKQIAGRNMLIHIFGSMQEALKWGYGLCLMRGDELLCESFAGPEANGVIEIGVETYPHHMHKGYATVTCAHLIHEMEGQGYRTYWNCAKDNLASIALARKLGFRTEKEYRLLAWFKHKANDKDQENQ
jgi:RimJ/RimL family protein N-acetyltransferase